jgi:hypothetical protein
VRALFVACEAADQIAMLDAPNLPHGGQAMIDDEVTREAWCG